MTLFLTVVDGQSSFPLAFTAVYVVGFIAAVGIGSLAWYNSKRPAGWENKERPDFIPDVEKDKTKSD
ncbi:MAG: photosystem II assembly protein Psb35 [Spirulinaceae cyanobacterium]